MSSSPSACSGTSTCRLFTTTMSKKPRYDQPYLHELVFRCRCVVLFLNTAIPIHSYTQNRVFYENVSPEVCITTKSGSHMVLALFSWYSLNMNAYRPEKSHFVHVLALTFSCPSLQKPPLSLEEARQMRQRLIDQARSKPAGSSENPSASS